MSNTKLIHCQSFGQRVNLVVFLSPKTYKKGELSVRVSMGVLTLIDLTVLQE